MKKFAALALAILTCVPISACSQEDNAQQAAEMGKSKPCQSEQRCVEVSIPSGKSPKVTPRKLIVKQTDPDFSFGLDQYAGNGHTYVIFKCQGQSVYDPVCRSPAVDANSKPVFVAKLKDTGHANKLMVAEPSAACKACMKSEEDPRADEEIEECVHKQCSYPYMVVDVKDENVPPLDPVVIIDPN